MDKSTNLLMEWTADNGKFEKFGWNQKVLTTTH
jgi:hypothetical protein